MSAVAMNGFLKRVRNEFIELDAGYKGESPTVILGNEGCDLDSVASSISTVAWIRIPGDNILRYSLTSVEKKSFWPVMNTTRSKFWTRSNVHWHLYGTYGFGIENLLVFIDEIKSMGPLRAILVDHNKTTYDFIRVIGVIDHHDDAVRNNNYELVLHCCKRMIKYRFSPYIVERVGSCMSIISELIFYDDRFLIDAMFARFMLAPIITDTIGLSHKMGRCNSKDFKMASALIQIIKGAQDPDVHFATLEAACEALLRASRDATSSVDDFTSQQILERDLKSTTTKNNYRIAIPMMPVCYTVKDFLNRDGSQAALLEFLTTNKCDAIVLLSILTENHGSNASISRELAVVSTNQELQKKIIAYLTDPDAELKLEEISTSMPISDQSLHIKHFKQNACDKSRKDILPLLSAFNL
ncbi:hypothetical protein ACOME3_009565 [Neoechinorhynchus agilis]